MDMRPTWIQSATVAIDDDSGALVVRSGGGVEVKRAVINEDSDAPVGNSIVAGVPEKRVCVLGLCLLAEEAVDVTFYSGTPLSGTALTGALPLSDRGGFVLPVVPDPSMAWMRTEPGDSLRLELSAGWRVSGWLLYCEEAA